MAQSDLVVTVWRDTETGRWTWDAVAGSTVLATGRDYDRPSRAIAAATKVTGRTPDVVDE